MRFSPTLLASTSVILASFSVVNTAPVHAAVVDSVIIPGSITVTNPGAPDKTLELFQNAQVDYDFSSSTPVHSGDTFTLTFPAGFETLTTTFPVYQTGSTTNILANCSLSAASDTVNATVGCAFTDYAATLSSVAGHITSGARMTKTMSESTVTFNVGNTQVKVDMPGDGPGVIGSTTPPPTEFLKNGYFQAGDVDQTVPRWIIILPGSQLAGKDINIVDHLPASVAQPTQIDLVSTPSQSGWDQAPVSHVDGMTSSYDASTHTMTYTIPGSIIVADQIYKIVYDTPITDAAAKEFANDAIINGVEKIAHVYKESYGNGNGDGSTTTPTTPTPPPATSTSNETPTPETPTPTPTPETPTPIPTPETSTSTPTPETPTSQPPTPSDTATTPVTSQSPTAGDMSTATDTTVTSSGDTTPSSGSVSPTSSSKVITPSSSGAATSPSVTAASDSTATTPDTFVPITSPSSGAQSMSTSSPASSTPTSNGSASHAVPTSETASTPSRTGSKNTGATSSTHPSSDSKTVVDTGGSVEQNWWERLVSWLS